MVIAAHPTAETCLFFQPVALLKWQSYLQRAYVFVTPFREHTMNHAVIMTSQAQCKAVICPVAKYSATN